jgi:hypothetical protein
MAARGVYRAKQEFFNNIGRKLAVPAGSTNGKNRRYLAVRTRPDEGPKHDSATLLSPAVKGSFGEGFRMPARRDLSSRSEGRRPKASQEGTRGGWAGGLPSMGRIRIP